ncbi:TrmH family RNA methyltransferase [Alienimonas chondri]|uniref:23S rRNA (Uridine(2479)-2'-O)-methyltransferase n=1 Tax=Alienimonas chondri TaxID=2681879 RepID=A0ABX1VGQ5_9PLAN|nr:RNA methyltransferase [Alienimonas chondri]NNJ27022.1 23S rRNA (uridine(2479)-2'-O)-methyltransferase [Alienimonas chondri]
MPEDLLKNYLTLRRARHERDRRGLFVIEGVGHFVAAVDAGATLRTILHCPRLLTSPVAQKLVRHRRRAGDRTVKLSPEAFRSLSSAPRASGVAAIVEQAVVPVEEVDPADGLFWLVLESIRSHGNLGTLLRTSAALGGGGVMIVDGAGGGTVDPFDPAAVRASMNALFRQQIVRTDLPRLRRWVERHGLQLVGTDSHGAIPFDRRSYHPSTLIALGDERTGLSERLAAACDATVRIPMRPRSDSLNLGVAGSLVMYAAAAGMG